MSAEEHLDDGQYLPGSAKEKAAMQALQGELAGIEPEGEPDSIPEYEGLPKLADWWPEPDWKAWVESGLPAQLAADLFFLRKNLPNRPPPPAFGVAADGWARMYLRAIEAMTLMLAGLQMTDTFDSLHKRYEALLEWTPSQLKDKRLDKEIAYAPYGLAKASLRRVRHPFSLTGLMHARRPVIASLGWPLDPDIPADPPWLPVELIDRSSGAVSWQVCRVNGSGYLPSGDEHDDEEMAIIDAILKIKADAREKEEGKGNPFDRPPVTGDIQRTGPDWREGRNISTDEFLARFRFRGIQFGNWVTQKERQNVLNQAWDALHDLTDICGLPPEAASLHGFIVGIAFGARGKPGSAAHWEPDQQIMHFTRMRGAGAIAHEWAHAADNFLGGLAYQSTIDAMTEYRPSDLEITHTRQHAYLTTIRETVRTFPQTTAMMKVKNAMRNRDGYDDALSRNRSIFLRDARQIDGPGGDYWQSTKELWARAFEAWVYDVLSEQGRCSDYLVFGVDEERWTLPGRPSPYPREAERARIGSSISGAMRAWREILSGNVAGD